MKSAPFSLSDGIDWVLPQPKRKPPVKANYVNLCCMCKKTTPYGVSSKQLETITQIFSEGDLEENGPVRILVQGKENLVLRLLFCRLSHCDIFYIFPVTKKYLCFIVSKHS